VSASANATIPPPSDGKLVAARRRPTAIVALWVLELGVAWVLASPWVETVSSVFGHHPDGDRALFWEPGHQFLTDVYIRYSSVISALFRSTIVGLTAWFLVSGVALGALMAALSDDARPSLRHAFSRAGETFGRLLLVQIASLAATCVVLGLFGVLPAMLLSSRTERWSSPHAAFVVTLAPVIVAGLASLALCAVADLARALVVRHGVAGTRAIVLAAKSPRAALSLLGLSVPRWVASAGAIGFAAAFASASSSILLVAIAHQLAALARVGLRASVLARALRVSDVVMAPASSVAAEGGG
jgi:hypothetical protein